MVLYDDICTAILFEKLAKSALNCESTTICFGFLLTLIVDSSISIFANPTNFTSSLLIGKRTNYSASNHPHHDVPTVAILAQVVWLKFVGSSCSAFDKAL